MLSMSKQAVITCKSKAALRQAQCVFTFTMFHRSTFVMLSEVETSLNRYKPCEGIRAGAGVNMRIK